MHAKSDHGGERLIGQTVDRLSALAGYGLGAVGANVAFFPINALLLYFLTDTLGLGIALATLIISAPKIWDMVADPAIGAYADRYARVHGRRFRVFVLVTLTLPALCAFPFLLPRLPAAGLAAAAIACLMVASSMFTIYQVSHAATADDLAVAGYASRTRMISVRIIGQVGGALAVGGLAPLLLRGGNGAAHGYLEMVLATTATAFVCLASCTFGLRRVPTTPGATQTTGAPRAGMPNLMRAFQAAARRPVAMGLVVSNIGVTMAASYLSNILPYVNKYALHAPDRALSLLFSAPTAAMLCGAAVMPWLARRLGSLPCFKLSSIGLLLAAALYYPAGGALPALLAAMIAGGLAIGGYSVLLQSILLDAAHGSDAGTGLAGLLLGLLFATAKIADALGGVLAGATLSRSAGGVRLDMGLVPVTLIALGTLAMWLLTRGPAAGETYVSSTTFNNYS